MTHETPLAIGIVGLGFIGNVVGEQFHHHPEATVAAVTDIDDDALASTGEAFSVPSGSRYADVEAMIDGESLDALLIGTPHTLHYEQILAGLSAGLDVLCDKPLTTDLDRAKHLVERVEGSDRTLMVGYQRHLNPAFAAARERFVEEGPRWITAEITQNWASGFEETWRTDPDLSGGGMLYDTGSHVLDAVLWTSGLEPEAVSASMTYLDDAERVDTEATVLIDFAGGETANVSVSGDLPAVREHIRFWDDDGAVALDGREWEPRTLTEIDADSAEHVPYIDRSEGPNKAEAFVTAVTEGSTPPATIRDALRVTAVTEAAYEAARTGERVSVDTSV